MDPLIGRMVTIFSPSAKQFLNVNVDTVGKSGVSSDGSLPSDWTWERFRAVDAGDHQVAFWNVFFKRFLRIDARPGMSVAEERTDGTLPGDWGWERFRVVDVGGGLQGLWSPIHMRFVRLSNDYRCPPNASEVRQDATMPSGWVEERLQIALAPGAYPTYFYCP